MTESWAGTLYESLFLGDWTASFIGALAVIGNNVPFFLGGSDALGILMLLLAASFFTGIVFAIHERAFAYAIVGASSAVLLALLVLGWHP